MKTKTFTDQIGRLMMTGFIFLFALPTVLAQQEPEDYTSPVPSYTFSTTLEEQEEELKINPLLLRFKESREKMSNDPHRPIYHYVNPESTLNDPNGLCFWQGNWPACGFFSPWQLLCMQFSCWRCERKKWRRRQQNTPVCRFS